MRRGERQGCQLEGFQCAHFNTITILMVNQEFWTFHSSDKSANKKKPPVGPHNKGKGIFSTYSMCTQNIPDLVWPGGTPRIPPDPTLTAIGVWKRWCIYTLFPPHEAPLNDSFHSSPLSLALSPTEWYWSEWVSAPNDKTNNYRDLCITPSPSNPPVSNDLHCSHNLTSMGTTVYPVTPPGHPLNVSTLSVHFVRTLTNRATWLGQSYGKNKTKSKVVFKNVIREIKKDTIRYFISMISIGVIFPWWLSG